MGDSYILALHSSPDYPHGILNPTVLTDLHHILVTDDLSVPQNFQDYSIAVCKKVLSDEGSLDSCTLLEVPLSTNLALF